MATFRPESRTCELNFDDKYIYHLPLHEDTADKIDNALKKMQSVAPKDRAGVDDAYNTALDVIDEILGVGAAENVMSIFDNPGTLEVWDILSYIMQEWNGAFSAYIDNLKKTMPTKNREQRRAEKSGRR